MGTSQSEQRVAISSKYKWSYQLLNSKVELMRNLEYRILNMKNLLEYIKTVQHLRRDKADMWIHVSDHNPSVFDRIQL